MSPPINLPDGSEVSEIVLPDGSTASEVVAPDGRTVFGGIPGTGLLRGYDFSSNNPLTELTGSGDDLSGSYQGTTTTINGVQAGEFDESSGDQLDVIFSTSFSEPVDVFFVYQADGYANDGSNNNYHFDDVDTTNGGAFNSNKNANYELRVGNSVSLGVGSNTNPNLLSIEWRDDSANTDKAYLNETKEADGGAGTAQYDGVVLNDAGGTDFVKVSQRVGTWRLYDPTASGYSRTDVETALVDKWGPF